MGRHLCVVRPKGPHQLPGVSRTPCRHTVSELGAGFVSEMRKPLRTRTYAQAKPKALTDEQW